ncbi:phenazine antibiotic biosynthesis protein [Actinokineospora sp. NBRC 105648]|uniref:phenazine antibiotic biosynthesis protein n=1 Tax=Actinokineospora sp. NBRC 105648 TaxID=3032206 RepID=UPI0024A0E122|nr:phenazine antibiotic biosynthesis protein [Actinokineospora sp. NBRC 105648]GLZ36592.1 phenazine antibiotic biosynthesis protein [Actinokineospora sp. NBRC 105648]
MAHNDPVLDLPFDVHPDPTEFLRAALRWHFSPATGSPFWLDRARELDFDPVEDITSFDDLTRFPNLANALREVPARDLVPRGYGASPGIVGIYDSGGTTGAPKRVALLNDWTDRMLDWSSAQLDRHGVPTGLNWLQVVPSGPHMVGETFTRQTIRRGGLPFTVDVDPRWVKRLIAEGRSAEAGAYTDHLVDQLAHPLESQDIGALLLTPPVLERLARREDLVALVRKKVKAIMWVGTQMDADTRHLYRTEVFPDTVMVSGFGNTMLLGHTCERPGLADGEPCVYDPFSPYMSFGVVDADTKRTVEYGERGRLVMHHVSKSMFLPNNLERDYGTRIRPLPGQVGDSVADISPVKVFEDEVVIEGVY